MARDPGDVFQQQTRYSRVEPGGGPVARPLRPGLYKEYAEAERVALPEPAWDQSTVTTLEAIQARRSVRAYEDGPLPLVHLSTLLAASAGITETRRGLAWRAAPSAGALYPVETYLVVNRVEGLEPGVYHYQVAHHDLVQLEPGDFRQAVVDAGGGQEMLGAAPVVFVWTALLDRCRHKYLARGLRYVYLDAGHVAAQLSVAAVALGLGSVQVGAFYDDELAAIVGVDLDDEPPVYLSAVGEAR